MHRMLPLAAAIALAAAATSAVAAEAPSDAQIANIAYTAGELDITAARQALDKSHNADVRAFAEEMVRDHAAVNRQAVDLVTKLKVTPEPNPTSAALTSAAEAKRAELATLDGAAFDKAYVANEVAYHRQVNGALSGTLIPAAHNGELRSLLQTGLKLFEEHQAHAEHLAAELK